MSQPLFFSVIVPAHNEEAYLEKTLQTLLVQNYPRDSFEIIVVENGSSDTTFAKAEAFTLASPRVEVFSLPDGGVSRARNYGVEQVTPHADWILFFDADTHMHPDFFTTLNTYLAKRPSHVIGTATLMPWPATGFMYFIYAFSNTFCLLFRSTYGGACFVRKDALLKEKFSEGMQVGEDAEFTNRVKKHGKYFFMATLKVATSTRRYTRRGWLLIPVYLALGLVAEFAPRVKTNLAYRVIR